MRRLFLFRPEPGASRSAERARSLGLSVTCIPLFAIEPVEWSPPEPGNFEGLLITSANALRMAGDRLERLLGLPAYCVGPSSARAAEVAGLGVAKVGRGGVEDLLAGLEPGMRLLHLCGEDRRAPDRPAQEITALTVYRARALPDPAGLSAMEGQVAAVHSPRSAARLAELADRPLRNSVLLAAISEAAAEAAGPGWRRVEIAAAPDETALLALAAQLCES